MRKLYTLITQKGTTFLAAVTITNHALEHIGNIKKGVEAP